VKIVLSCMALALMLLSTGCGGLKPGDEQMGELTRDSRLSEFMTDAESVMFEAGRPVSDDWACASASLRSGGSVAVEVESEEFDPILIAIDKEGSLLAFNDDWEGSNNSRIVFRDVPGGTEVLVTGIDGERGEYVLTVSEAEDKDCTEFEEATNLSGGIVLGEIVEEKEDELLDEALSDALGQYTWLTDYSRGMIFPFTVTEGGLCSVNLISENTSELDPILAIVEIDDDEYDYVAYNDDYGMDFNARVDEILEPGSYAAVVLSYSEEGGGEFTLTLDRYDASALIPTVVDVSAPGMLYEGEIVEDAGLAAGVWPTIATMKPYEVITSAASPCAFFQFTVSPSQTGLYDVEASSGDLDVFLTVLERDADSVLYVACNDDFGGSTDSRITRVLPAGDYLAMISAIGEPGAGSVDFSFQPSRINIIPLEPRRPIEADVSAGAPQIACTFEAVQGKIYTVTATAIDEGTGSTVDTYLEILLPDGTLLANDDYEGLNSQLRIDPTAEQLGRVFVMVRDYGNYTTGPVRIELTDEGRAGSQVRSIVD